MPKYDIEITFTGIEAASPEHALSLLKERALDTQPWSWLTGEPMESDEQ